MFSLSEASFEVQVYTWNTDDWLIWFHHNFSAGLLESPSYRLGYTLARKVSVGSHTSIT